jgi:hypothetical protein
MQKYLMVNGLMDLIVDPKIHALLNDIRKGTSCTATHILVL